VARARCSPEKPSPSSANSAPPSPSAASSARPPCSPRFALRRCSTRPLRQPIARELSRFQAVERDFSFVFPDAIQWETISTALTRLGIAELQSVTPVEIFRDAKGKAIPAGSHSLLVRVVFQSLERTLTEDELTGWSHQIIAALTSLGGAQRA
jgi:phenylalanyl-tRNA synthetase beta chain